MTFQKARQLLKRKRVLILLAGIIVLSGVSLSFGLFGKSSKPGEFFTAAVQRGPIRTVVDATGTLQTLVTVQVGSQVSGQIEALYADFNSVVKRGQLLAKLDPRNFDAQVENSQANLAAAEAHTQSLKEDLITQEAGLASAQANLDAAQVDRNNTLAILKRNQELLDEGLVAENDFDTVKANADAAAARVQQAQAAVRVAQAQIQGAQAQIKQAEAQILQAKADLNGKKINLAYTDIYSPVDGVVVSRNVDVGQTVAASLQAPVLFVIANDLTKMQVNASVDEADIGHISREAGVRFTVDAYPNRHFTGTIGEIRLDPQTVQNVVTYSVIINVDNRSLELRPGMTANITFTVDSRADAVKIPNAALRYTPAGVTPQQIAAMLPKSPAAAAPDQPGSRITLRSAVTNGQAGGAVVDPPARHVAAPPEAPGQLWNPEDKIRFGEARQSSPRPAVVWVLDSSGKPVPERVWLGITDGAATEVTAGDLKPGEQVIIADASAAASGASRPGVMPFGFGGRGGRR